MNELKAKIARFEGQITEIIINAIDKEELTTDQAREITAFWLPRVKSITAEDALATLVEDLSARWPMFNSVVIIEQGEIRSEDEKKITEEVISLVKDGKIEEAVQLAKAANN